MKQYEILKDKVAKKARIVLSKFLSKQNSRELSNQDLSILLCSYSINNHIEDSKLCDLHNRLSKLNKLEMEIITMYFWEGKTQEEIGKHFGKSRAWSQQSLTNVLDKLRTIEIPTTETL